MDYTLISQTWLRRQDQKAWAILSLQALERPKHSSTRHRAAEECHIGSHRGASEEGVRPSTLDRLQDPGCQPFGHPRVSYSVLDFGLSCLGFFTSECSLHLIEHQKGQWTLPSSYQLSCSPPLRLHLWKIVRRVSAYSSQGHQ